MSHVLPSHIPSTTLSDISHLALIWSLSPNGIGASSFISSASEPHLSLSTFLCALASSFILLNLVRISYISSSEKKTPMSAWEAQKSSTGSMTRIFTPASNYTSSRIVRRTFPDQLRCNLLADIRYTAVARGRPIKAYHQRQPPGLRPIQSLRARRTPIRQTLLECRPVATS